MSVYSTPARTAVEQYFFDDYSASRAQFATLATACGADISHRPIQAKGGAGENLFITIAKIGADKPKKLLVLLSATHGLEGPAGAAIQAQFLAEDLPDMRLPKGTAIILVHGVNPYGWSRGRRQNEDNIDLNRNFADFSQNHPASDGYIKLDPLINPTEMSDAVMNRLAKEAEALIAEHGMPWLQKVISEGQYQFPKGLNYGGNAPAEANSLLRKALGGYLESCEEGLIIDIHTGLGPSGLGAVLSGEPSGSDGHEWLEEAYAGFDVKALYGDSHCDLPATKGKLARALGEYAPTPNMRSFTLEFGTYEPMRVFMAGFRENWLHHFGDRASTLGQEIQTEAREVYNPIDAAWRGAVLAGGRAAIAAGWRALTV